MKTETKISTIYTCSLERTFKSPMLCYISKVHNGYLVIPKVTHYTEDENLEKPDFSKKVYAAKSLTQKGGWISVDKVIERIENGN
jgi:hypothetical protein